MDFNRKLIWIFCLGWGRRLFVWLRGEMFYTKSYVFLNGTTDEAYDFIFALGIELCNNQPVCG
jgi:hypothetical protein